MIHFALPSFKETLLSLCLILNMFKSELWDVILWKAFLCFIFQFHNIYKIFQDICCSHLSYEITFLDYCKKEYIFLRLYKKNSLWLDHKSLIQIIAYIKFYAYQSINLFCHIIVDFIFQQKYSISPFSQIHWRLKM